MAAGMAVVNRASDPAGEAIASGTRTLRAERDGLDVLMRAMREDLGAPFAAAVDLMAAAQGRIMVTGMGKSGHIGRKIAATLTSTGTPAYYMHPSDASHGDLGMIRADRDVIVALSWSGETTELSDLIFYAKRFRVPLVAITARADSTLGRQADVCLALPRAREACPNGLAPTTSTTMQLALGDALALALLEVRGFSANDFGRFHPGGKLGAQLKQARDIMHTGEHLPLIRLGASVGEAILVQSEKGFGCVLIVDGAGELSGIITDGDLRRHMGDRLLSQTVEEVMTPHPVTIPPGTLLGEALDIVDSTKKTALIVADGGKPVGLIHVLDLLRAGVA
jgi:arabinose-5-phosphate isomerase